MSRVENKIVIAGGSGELIEKKSKFISFLLPVTSIEQAGQEINKIKKKYYDARHVCFAYIIEGKPEICRQSDDGEPSGTAGKPMLDVLEGKGIVNALFVCVRYFGGTLLGTGGLVRAYQGAAKMAFEKATIGMKIPGIEVEVISSYEDHGAIQYMLDQREIDVKNTDYLECVTMTLHIADDAYERLEKELAERTAARAKISKKKDVFLIEKI